MHPRSYLHQPGLSYIYEVVRSFTTHTVNGDIMYEAVRHPLAAEDSSATPSANATTFLVKAEKAAFDRLGKGESIRWILNNTQAGVLRCLHGARQSSEDSCPALQHIPVHLEDNLLWRAGARGSDWIGTFCHTLSLSLCSQCRPCSLRNGNGAGRPSLRGDEPCAGPTSSSSSEAIPSTGDNSRGRQLLCHAMTPLSS